MGHNPIAPSILIWKPHRFIFDNRFCCLSAQPRAHLLADRAPGLVRMGRGAAGAKLGEGEFHLEFLHRITIENISQSTAIIKAAVAASTVASCLSLETPFPNTAKPMKAIKTKTVLLISRPPLSSATPQGWSEPRRDLFRIHP